MVKTYVLNRKHPVLKNPEAFDGIYIYSLFINGMGTLNNSFMRQKASLYRGETTPHEVLGRLTTVLDKFLMNCKTLPPEIKSSAFVFAIEKYRKKLGLDYVFDYSDFP